MSIVAPLGADRNHFVAGGPSAATAQHIPQQLRAVPQWVAWALGGNQRGGKYAKVPYSPITANPADPTDPRTWGRFHDALDLYQSSNNGFDGVGFMFAPNGRLAGVDLDECRDRETGDLSADAKRLLADLDSYTEVSPSGTGVKVFVQGRLDPAGPHRRNGVEVYDRDRFFTLTGHRLDAYPADVRPTGDVLGRLQDSLRLPAPGRNRTESKGTGRGTRPQAQHSPEVDAAGFEALLARMAEATNFPAIKAYMAGDRQGKSSASEALLGLAQLAAFWTGPDAGRLEAFLRRTRLWADAEGERAKWDSARGPESWGLRYIVRKAIDTCGAFHPVTGHCSLSSPTTPTPTHTHTPTLCKNGVPFATAVGRAWGRVTSEPIPAFIVRRVTTRKRAGLVAKQRLATLCHHLAFDQGGTFFLSSTDAAGLLGVDRATASKWLTDFQQPHVRLIRLTRRGSSRSGMASEYVWTGPTPATVAA